MKAGNLLAMHVIHYGPWFWVHIIYSYILLLIGSYQIIRQALAGPELFRYQSLWMMIGVGFAAAINLIYVLRLIPGWTKDYSPLGFALGGLSFAIGIYRYRLLDVRPVARDALFEWLEDGIIVLDDHERLVDFNPVAQRFLKTDGARLIGASATEALIFKLEPYHSPAPNTRAEFTLESGNQKRIYEMRRLNVAGEGSMEGLDPLAGSGLKLTGQVLILHDITRQREMIAEIERLARLDPLTGLYNRRAFMDLASREIERSRRSGRPISLLMLDLDGFKQANDSFGHAAGDYLLEEVADSMRRTCRAMDTPARLGGDEFAVLLPETTLEGAHTVADRLAEDICLISAGPADAPMHISASIGPAVWIPSSESHIKSVLETLLGQADAEMYRIKQQKKKPQDQ